jgi:hypothetical protein
VKCFVAFRLKPGVTREAYEEWFREVNVPAISRMTTVGTYRVWVVTGAMEGEPPFDVVEEMEIERRESFESELDSVPEVAAMLTQWYERVAEPVVVYAEEVPQSR